MVLVVLVSTWLNPFFPSLFLLVSYDIGHRFLAGSLITTVRSRQDLGSISELNRGSGISFGSFCISVENVYELASSGLATRGGFSSCPVRRGFRNTSCVIVLQGGSVFGLRSGCRLPLCLKF